MTCLEAQTKIMAFIDNKLSDEELYDFVKHVKNCKNCSEELEIYYTLLVGMKQLDNNENLSTDFSRDLEKKLDDSMHRLNNTNKLKKSSVAIIVMAVLAAGIVGYNNFLGWVYHKEQDLKLSRQSEYYFYDTFKDVVFDEHRMLLRELMISTEPKQPDETTAFYRKIHQYHVNQAIINEEEKNEESIID